MQNATDVLRQLDRLTGHAWHVWLKIHRAFKALSAAPLPGSQWRPALRPGREALCRFVKELRATRRAYQQICGYDPEHLGRIERDALLVMRRLSWVAREAATATSKEQMDDWLHLLENLRDFIGDIARATKRAWKVFKELHMTDASSMNVPSG